MVIEQLTHQQVRNEQRQFPVVVVCQDVSDPLNVGAIFRLADALGVGRLYLCGATPAPPNRRIKKTARSTDEFVPFIYAGSTRSALEDLRALGYTLVGLEITDQSVPLHRMDLQRAEKIGLVIGSENRGLLPETLELLDFAVHIPMYGRNTSMNVVQACAIALYEITRLMQ